MFLLLLGLVIFLGIHSTKIFANNWRIQTIETRGEGFYKGVYSALSLLGFVIIIVGYGQTRQDPIFLWHPPMAMMHVASLLMLLAFILLAATYVPGNRIKQSVGHPMVLAVKVWAVAHLLANGRLGDIILFSAFLAWAVLDFVNSRKRDRSEGITYPSKSSIVTDAVTVILGIVAWLIFAMWAHTWLIGVSPFGIN